MARFDGKFIKGIVGKITFRESKGLQIIQQRTEKPEINKTKGTKDASTVFGKASNLSTFIRDNFSALIRANYDSDMTQRLNSDVLAGLRSALIKETQTFEFEPTSFNRLIGFEFNIKSPFKDNFFAQPVIHVSGDQMVVAIPEMDLNSDMVFPKGIKKCKLVLGHIMLDLLYGHYNETEYAVLDIDYDRNNPVIPPQTAQFDIQPGCLSVICIGIQYIETTFIGDTIINNKDFSPVALLNAFIADGNVNKAVTDKWYEMPFKSYVPPMLPPPAT